jgi:hypothetical protein
MDALIIAGWAVIAVVLAWRAVIVSRQGRQALAVLFALIALHYVRLIVEPGLLPAFRNSDLSIAVTAGYIIVAVLVVIEEWR